MQLYCSNGLGQPLAKWIKVDVSINVAVDRAQGREAQEFLARAFLQQVSETEPQHQSERDSQAEERNQNAHPR